MKYFFYIRICTFFYMPKSPAATATEKLEHVINQVFMTIISVKSLLEKCHYLTFLRDITFSRPPIVSS
jgi:hypothetical protein